jgi:glutamate-1-semialdehyde 2,1-aminomutase
MTSTPRSGPLARTRSAELFERGREVLVDGVSSPSRGPLNFRPHPIFMARGAGAEIIDADENRYVDLMLAYGALIHGHAHPALVEALQDAAGRGALFATASEVEVEVAERICAMVACAEKVSFASTGTEAAMAALRLVRGFTGRQTIVKFEGHYHGWADAYSVSSNPLPAGAFGHPNDPIRVPDTSGVTPGSIQDTLVLPWNDVDRLEALLKARAGDVAAVVTEPVMANMGVIPPAEGFLEAVRELTTRFGVLLYIDETVTGFRLGPGGAQQRYGVTADLTTFGKGLGAGLPVAALAGRSDIMSALSGGRILHYGTQNANPLLLSVVRRSLDLLTADDNLVFTRLEGLADRLVAGLRDAIERAGVAALVQSAGPMLQVYFLRRGHESVESIRGARDFGAHVDQDTFNHFAHLLLAEGVYLSPSPALHSVLSTVHTEAHVDEVVAAAGRALAQLTDGSR